MLTRILKSTLCGTVIGLLLGVISGGLWSSLFGQPFSGATGLKVFHLGMFFPGLVIVAPVTAGIGAVCGASAGWMRRRKGSRDGRDVE
ncbi:MAG: hypothetical protein O3C40_36850 [Planctomycetota bacterium]|nr:hypothetical protein [Planctomycetota bacterium]